MAEPTSVDVERAVQNYRYYPNVLGIGAGTKFKDGARVPAVRAIQFFVSDKVSLDQLKKALPRFVYGRTEGGDIDQSVRIPTDVIPLRNVELCCAAGEELAVVQGGSGATTLIFRNKVPSGKLLVLTCSHVVGEMAASPATNQEIRGGSTACMFQAKLLSNTVLDQSRLEFDIALGELLPASQSVVELAMKGSAQPCDGFASLAALPEGQVLTGAFPLTPGPVTRESSKIEVREIDAGAAGVITIGNLYACRGTVIKGDSGGPIFHGTKVAGILVAKADDDWILVHALSDAVAHLAAKAATPIICF